ncbi:hypothetical protein ES703_105417 [subsurface metagenome]
MVSINISILEAWKMIELICGDSMKILPDLFKKTKSFDMIFLDPPFTEWHASELGKYNVNSLSYCVNRLLRPNGVVWLWGYAPQLINDWRYWNRWFKCIFDMIRIKPAGHPTQKPLKMVKMLVETSTDVNDWILDPFAGSSVTLQAAQELNRNCIGIEISPKYCKMKRRRLERVRVITKLSKFLKLTP